MKRNGYGKKLISGALILTLSGVIVKALGLFYKIPLSYILSDEGMSYFNSAYTVYTFFYIICTAGIPKAIAILVSEAEGRGEIQRINKIYNTSFFFFTFLGISVSILFFLISFPLAKIIGSSNSALAMLAVAPSVALTCSAGVIRGYFSGKMDFVPLAVSEAVSGVSRLVFGLLLALVAYRLGYNLIIISAMTILGTSIGSFAGLVYLLIRKKRENCSVNTGQKELSRCFEYDIARRILKIAIPITLTVAVGSISSIIDLFVIMNRLNAVGYSELQSNIMYGNYTTLVIPMLNLIATLIAPLSTVLLPVISKADIKNNSLLLTDRISFTVKIAFFVSIPAFFLFLMRSREILSILFEDSGAAMASVMLSLLAPGVVFMCLAGVVNTSLEGLGNTKIPLISLIIGSVVKLFFTYCLVGNELIGILGAPIGTTVSYFISFAISVYFLSYSKKIKIKFIPSLLPAVLSSAFAILISSVYKHFFGSEKLLSYLIELSIFGIIYVIFMLLNYLQCVNKAKKSSKYTKNGSLSYL